MTGLELLEKPLPKPGRDLVGYAGARALEAILESLLALEYLGKGYTRNAAGKAFQAWKALTGSLLALRHEEIVSRLKDREAKWLVEKGVPRIPSSRLKPLARLLEEIGVENYSFYTDRALLLHDYQYHGPDPDMELSKYRSRTEAARDIVQLIEKLAEILEKHVKPKLSEKRAWSKDHEEALHKLREKLKELQAG